MSTVSSCPSFKEMHAHLDHVHELEETPLEKAHRLSQAIIPHVTQTFNVQYQATQISKDVKVEAAPQVSVTLDAQGSTVKKKYKTIEEQMEALYEAYENEKNDEKKNHLLFRLFLLISREFDRINHEDKQKYYEYLKQHFQRMEKNSKDPLQFGLTIAGGVASVLAGFAGFGQGPTLENISKGLNMLAQGAGPIASLPQSLNQFDTKVADHMATEEREKINAAQSNQAQVRQQNTEFIRHLRQAEEANTNARQAAIGN